MGVSVHGNDLSNIGQGLSQIPSMNKLNDVSSSAVGNFSMVDIGSEDIEGATTLALNMTKSNDLNSAYTRKTP